VAKAMGTTRGTMYNHLQRAGIPSERPEFTAISDAELDDVIAEISLAHPFIGSVIILGHLEAKGIHLPHERVQESLRRVDAIASCLQGPRINALWHQDGNEKLHHWGFWVHGCVD
ncbi:hypothetical protein EDD85DRAFT_726852, partial [Armillaria nabsnona]